MRKFVVLFIVVALLVQLLPLSFASADVAPTLRVDGRIIDLQGESPFIVNGRSFFPIRFFAELFNIPVVWHERTNTVEVGSGLGYIKYWLNTNMFVFRDHPKERMEFMANPIMRNGRLFMPLSDIMRVAGRSAHFDWIGGSNTLVIETFEYRAQKELTERLAREEAERLAREEAERLAREQAERLAREEAERLARENPERITIERAERLAAEMEIRNRVVSGRRAVSELTRVLIPKVEARLRPENTRDLLAPVFVYRGVEVKFPAEHPPVYWYNFGDFRYRVTLPILPILRAKGVDFRVESGYVVYDYLGMNVRIPIAITAIRTLHEGADGYHFGSNTSLRPRVNGVDVGPLDASAMYVDLVALVRVVDAVASVTEVKNGAVAVFGIHGGLSELTELDKLRLATITVNKIPLGAYLLDGVYRNWELITEREFGVVRGKAEEITSGATDDMDKLRRLSVWVARNIRYDFDALMQYRRGEPMTLRGEEGTYSMAYAVLKYRLNVCSGYTALLNTMLFAVGIPARSVYTGSHVWTDAFVNGRWVGLDSTWMTTSIDRWFDFTHERSPLSTGSWVGGFSRIQVGRFLSVPNR